MTEITLNNCLNKLDSIIFSDVDNYKNEIHVREILNDVRSYIINSREDNMNYDKKAFMVILELINFLIQESYEAITNVFINRLVSLRFMIIKFKDNRLLIGNREIDFENKCNTFLYNIINNNGFDYGDNQNENVSE